MQQHVTSIASSQIPCDVRGVHFCSLDTNSGMQWCSASMRMDTHLSTQLKQLTSTKVYYVATGHAQGSSLV